MSMTPLEILAEYIQGNYPKADIVPHGDSARKLEVFAGPGKWVIVDYNDVTKTFHVADRCGEQVGTIDGAFLLVRELLDRARTELADGGLKAAIQDILEKEGGEHHQVCCQCTHAIAALLK